jgi:homoserine O-succinyltransferase
LKEKRFGIFDCQLVADHPMLLDFPVPVCVPHSRYNDLPERPLASCGYRILTRSVTAGVDMFAKLDGSFFLFFQGHPEYDADSLLREYRRDAARFLNGERYRYPAMPFGYFNAESEALAEAFRIRARTERKPQLIAEFPKSALETGLQGPWRPAAVGIYEKWAAYLRARKTERLTMPVPLGGTRMRRSWRDWPAALRRPADTSVR